MYGGFTLLEDGDMPPPTGMYIPYAERLTDAVPKKRKRDTHKANDGKNKRSKLKELVDSPVYDPGELMKNTSNNNSVYAQVFGDAQPSLTFVNPFNPLSIKDLQELISYVLMDYISPKWAYVKHKYLIKKVILIVYSSLSGQLYDQCVSSKIITHLPELFPTKLLTRAPGSNNRAYSGVSVLMRRKINSKTAHKKKKEGAKGTPITQPEDLLLSFPELQENNYPLKLETPDFVETHAWENESAKKWLAIDCEMARTRAGGTTLIRASFVDEEGHVLYDTLVKPQEEVVDYLTKWSGIQESDLEAVTTTVRDVQTQFQSLVNGNTILVGHSLENDLRALKIAHHRVIDTAILYPHPRGSPYKNALKVLVEQFLKRKDFQEGAHDSIEDARMAMALVKLKMANGHEFGLPGTGTDEENLTETLQRAQKKSLLIDLPSGCQKYAASNTDCKGEVCDEMILETLLKNAASAHHFVFAQLHDLDNYYNPAKPELVGEAPTPEVALQRFDTFLPKLQAKMPPGTLLLITGCNGNLYPMHDLMAKKRRNRPGSEGAQNPDTEETWGEAEEAELERVVSESRKTVSLAYIKPLDLANKPS